LAATRWNQRGTSPVHHALFLVREKYNKVTLVLLAAYDKKHSRRCAMEHTGGTAGFETIAQMLLEQKRRMEALEQENLELRRQLASLHRGEGIVVEISGKQLRLAAQEMPPSSQQDESPAQNEPPTANPRRGERGSSRSQTGERERDHPANSSLASSYTL
jgi:hypothetical protein